MTVELIVCPLCNRIIHRHDATPASSRAMISSRANSTATLLQMMAEMEADHRERVRAAEQACEVHYARRHGVRLWLWRRLHWDPIMNRRWILWGGKVGEEFRYSGQES